MDVSVGPKLRQEHWLRVSDDRASKKVLGQEREKVAGEGGSKRRGRN